MKILKVKTRWRIMKWIKYKILKQSSSVGRVLFHDICPLYYLYHGFHIVWASGGQWQKNWFANGRHTFDSGSEEGPGSREMTTQFAVLPKSMTEVALGGTVHNITKIKMQYVSMYQIGKVLFISYLKTQIAWLLTCSLLVIQIARIRKKRKTKRARF